LYFYSFVKRKMQKYEKTSSIFQPLVS
jgi:hypothetical protein